MLELVGPNAIKLNTPSRIHLVLNVNKLRLVVIDLLPSQLLDNAKPEPIKIKGEEEYLVKEIVEERKRRNRKEYLVK